MNDTPINYNMDNMQLCHIHDEHYHEEDGCERCNDEDGYIFWNEV